LPTPLSVILDTLPLALIETVFNPLKLTHALAENDGAEPVAVDSAAGAGKLVKDAPLTAGNVPVNPLASKPLDVIDTTSVPPDCIFTSPLVSDVKTNPLLVSALIILAIL
jgi:hypothetical protein